MAAKLQGQADIAVTATVQTVAVPDATINYTLRNAGANALFYRYLPPQGEAVTALSGNATVLKAAGGVELPAGGAVLLPAGVPSLQVVCATGLTTTAQLLPGMAGLATAAKQDELLAELRGGDYTLLDPLPFEADDETIELAAAVNGKRLHVLGYMIDEIEAEVTSLKLVDTDDPPVEVHDFGAFANGGAVFRPPLFPVRPYHSVQDNLGLSLVIAGAGCRGTILLATTDCEPDEEE